MNFLAPWFLLGALAVAGPVIFHLIRRSARERVTFSSLLFLRPVPPRATRRRKLEHILLLCLRCLAVVLLALGFARPFFPSSAAAPPATEEGREVVLLLDTSASMRRTGLWEKARSRAESYLDKAAPMDRMAIMAFDRQPRAVVTFSEWSSWPVEQRAGLARRRLETLAPSWNGTQLGAALIAAAEEFPDEAARATASARDVVLISDLQEGAKLEGLQGHDWPKNEHVVIERVDPEHRGNAGLEILAGEGRQPRARVVNSRDAGEERFQVAWAGANGKAADVYVPPGQTRSVAVSELPTNAESGALHLTGDAEDFDNTAYFAAPQMERVSIAYFGSESANDPSQLRYYLQRAFPGSPQRSVEVAPTGTAALSNAALAVIPASLSAEQAGALRDWMADGKTALLVMTNAAAGAALSAVGGLTGIGVSEGTGDYALLADIDFTHPIFALFADPKYSDFSRIHFWKHRRWTPPEGAKVRVLAKFDDGSPALAQVSMGRGSLLVLAAGWQPADSQLALSSKFVPLLQTILDYASPAPPSRSQFQIGDAIPSPVASGADLTWRKPDGKTLTVGAGKSFSETDAPGIYEASGEGKRWEFAVNLAPEESRTAPLSADDLARLGVPLGNKVEEPVVKSPVAQRRVAEEALEGRQKVWRWMIVALLAAAIVEIGVEGWLARREPAVEAAA